MPEVFLVRRNDDRRSRHGHRRHRHDRSRSRDIHHHDFRYGNCRDHHHHRRPRTPDYSEEDYDHHGRGRRRDNSTDNAPRRERRGSIEDLIPGLYADRRRRWAEDNTRQSARDSERELGRGRGAQEREDFMRLQLLKREAERVNAQAQREMPDMHEDTAAYDKWLDTTTKRLTELVEAMEGLGR